jgi:hypothetical protein
MSSNNPNVDNSSTLATSPIKTDFAVNSSKSLPVSKTSDTPPSAQ